MSYKEPNRPPVAGPTADYHFGNEALERAEFEAGVSRYNKKAKPPGLLGQLKALFRRLGR